MADELDDGVELHFVGASIPVIHMESHCAFYQHTSWMLQTALSVNSKVASLYTNFQDEELLEEVCRLGYTPDEISLVRIRLEQLAFIKAIGVGGKRSEMLALVVALGLKFSESLMPLFEELQKSGLGEQLAALLQSAAMKPAELGEDPEETMKEALQEVQSEGVEFLLTKSHVPVLDLAHDSIFQEHSAWLLQSATGESGKADSLYEYYDDPEVVRECEDRGLKNISTARLVSQPEVKAASGAGKRSMMLSLVLALVIAKQVGTAKLMQQAGEGSPSENPGLVRAMQALLKATLILCGRPTQWVKTEGTFQPKSESNRKRKQKEWYESQKKSAKSRGRGGSSSQGLDDQLEAYWGSDPR